MARLLCSRRTEIIFHVTFFANTIKMRHAFVDHAIQMTTSKKKLAGSFTGEEICDSRGIETSREYNVITRAKRFRRRRKGIRTEMCSRCRNRLCGRQLVERCHHVKYVWEKLAFLRPQKSPVYQRAEWNQIITPIERMKAISEVGKFQNGMSLSRKYSRPLQYRA